MKNSASSSHRDDAFELTGSNIIENFRNLGYHTIGTGAVAWFDQKRRLGLYFHRHLINFGTAARHGNSVLSYPGYLSK